MELGLGLGLGLELELGVGVGLELGLELGLGREQTFTTSPVKGFTSEVRSTNTGEKPISKSYSKTVHQ